jgi:hypothetical protein
MLADRFVEAEVETYAGNGKLLAYLGGHAVITEKKYEGNQVILSVRMARHLLDRINPEDAQVRIRAS